MKTPVSFHSMNLRYDPKNPIYVGECPACKYRTFMDDPEGIYFETIPPVITVKCTKCGLTGLIETGSWELIQGFFRV